MSMRAVRLWRSCVVSGRGFKPGTLIPSQCSVTVTVFRCAFSGSVRRILFCPEGLVDLDLFGMFLQGTAGPLDGAAICNKIPWYEVFCSYLQVVSRNLTKIAVLQITGD